MRISIAKTIKKSCLLITSLGISTSVIYAGGHAAKNFEVEGKIYSRTTHSDGMELSPGQNMWRNTTAGIFMYSKIRSDLPKEISFDCLERGIMKGMDFSTMYAAGSCEASDPSGDIYIFNYHGNGPAGNWTIIGGTGKFEGMSGSGEFTIETPLGNAGAIGSFSGKFMYK